MRRSAPHRAARARYAYAPWDTLRKCRMAGTLSQPCQAPFGMQEVAAGHDIGKMKDLEQAVSACFGMARIGSVATPRWTMRPTRAQEKPATQGLSLPNASSQI